MRLGRRPGEKKSFHLRIPIDLYRKVKDFADNRDVSVSAILLYAIEELFLHESIDPRKEDALSRAMETKFQIPSGHTLRSFWQTLCNLCVKYPDESSKHYWGDTVYLSAYDRTHREIFFRIREEADILLGNKKDEKKDKG